MPFSWPARISQFLEIDLFTTYTLLCDLSIKLNQWLVQGTTQAGTSSFSNGILFFRVKSLNIMYKKKISKAFSYLNKLLDWLIFSYHP